MMIDGVYRPNATCPHCKHRHPLDVSCQAAQDLARAAVRERATHDDDAPGSHPWVPKHDKDFLSGQRVIYNRLNIVHFLYWKDRGMRGAIRTVEGDILYVDPINLIPLPGGQL